MLLQTPPASDPYNQPWNTVSAAFFPEATRPINGIRLKITVKNVKGWHSIRVVGLRCSSQNQWRAKAIALARDFIQHADDQGSEQLYVFAIDPDGTLVTRVEYSYYFGNGDREVQFVSLADALVGSGFAKLNLSELSYFNSNTREQLAKEELWAKSHRLGMWSTAPDSSFF